MAIAQLLQEHGELGHGLGDLHVGQVALEEDGALRPLGAFVVQGIGGRHSFVVRTVEGEGRGLLRFGGHHGGRHRCGHFVSCLCVSPFDHGRGVAAWRGLVRGSTISLAHKKVGGAVTCDPLAGSCSPPKLFDVDDEEVLQPLVVVRRHP
jgi:hypothetical protein